MTVLNILSLLILHFISLLNAKYILFARDWLENPQGLAGWSNTTTELCDGQIMDANKLVFMLDKTIPSVNKTFENLPKHWSVGIRLDFIIVDNWKGATMNVKFNDKQLGHYVSSGKGKKLLICGYPKEEDKYERVYYNVTNEEDKFMLKIEHSITNYAKLALIDLQIYLELCDQSCSSCKGPTNRDCTACGQGLIISEGMCICQTGFMHQGICLEQCPDLYNSDVVSKICQPDPCQVNCKSCDANTSKCVQCQDGYYLQYGECVDVCPSYSQQDNGICIDEMHKYWNGTYLVKAFFGNDFSQPEIAAHHFQSNFYDDEDIIPKENWAQFSDCSTYRLYGGFGLYGRKTFIKNEWVIPWYHSSVRIRFFYAQIENYEKDPETGEDEKLSIYLNGVEKWFMIKGQDNKNACGRLDQGENFGWLEANMTNLHKGDKLTFEVKNNFYDPAWFEGFGFREFTVIVDRCTMDCIECKDNVGCVKCSADYFLYNGNCISTCPSGYYGDTQTMSCQLCNKDCQECNQKQNTNCTKCRQDSYLHKGMCLSTCPSQFYQNSASNICSSCIQGCSSCTETTRDTCQTCHTGYYIIDNICYSSCPEGYYLDQIAQIDQIDKMNQSSYQCIKCNARCKGCTGSSEKECISCKQNSNTFLYEKECMEICPDKYYAEQSVSECLVCDNSCKTCSAQGNHNCIECQQSLYFQDGQCLPQCQEGYFQDYTTLTCQSCTQGCKICNTIANNQCVSCFHDYNLLEGTCLKTCPTNYFQSKFYNQCQRCHSTCSECNGVNDDQCTACKNTYYLHDNKCLSDCPEGFIGQNKTCQKCSDNCLMCISLSSQQQLHHKLIEQQTCQKCQIGYYLIEGECVSTCPEYSFGDDILNICRECPIGCICRGGKCAECNGKNRLTYQENCICMEDHKDIIGRNSRQTINCVPFVQSPSPQIIFQTAPQLIPTAQNQQQPQQQPQLQYQQGDRQQQKQQRDKISYRIKGILRFDKEVQIGEYKSWIITIPNSNAYSIELIPFEIKRVTSDVSDESIESPQQFYINIDILDSSKIASDSMRIEFVDIYSVQDASENPLSVSFLEQKIPFMHTIITPEPLGRQIYESDQECNFKSFNLGMDIFMSLFVIVFSLQIGMQRSIHLFDLLSIVNHIYYLNIRYPCYLSYFFKIFDVFNIYVLPIFKKRESTNNSNSPLKFRNDGIETLIFYNVSQCLIVWLFFIVLYMLSRLHNKKGISGKLKQLLYQYHTNFISKILFTIAYITYSNLFLYTLLQLQQSSFESVLTSLGTLFCLIVLLPYFAMLHYYTYQSCQYPINQIIQDQKMNKNFGLFLHGIKKVQGKNIVYSIILARKTLLMIFLVFSQTDHIKQILVWSLIIGLETLAISLLLPFQLKSENKTHIMCRMLLICALICIAALGIDDISQSYSDESRMLLSVLIILFSSLLFFTYIFSFVYARCKLQLFQLSLSQAQINKSIHHF